MLGVLGDLCEEGIIEQKGGFIAVPGGGIAEQGGDIDLQGAGQAIQGREGGHGLAILDLGDVGSRNGHASGKLTLGEITHVTEVAHGGGNLWTCFGDIRGSFHHQCDGGLNLWRLWQERLLAPPTGVRSGAELYQFAGFTADDLACGLLDRKSGSRS